MSNLNYRRLIGAGQRYKLAIWLAMFDLKCCEGQEKGDCIPPLSYASLSISLIPLVKISFSPQALVSFAAVLRLVTQRSSSTNGEEERCVTSLRTAEKETCLCVCCKLFVRLCPTSLQRWVTRSCQTWVEMLDTIKASEQPDKKFGLTTNNGPISMFQPESPAKLTTKLENNMISVKKHNNGNRPLAFSFQLRYLAVYCKLL